MIFAVIQGLRSCSWIVFFLSHPTLMEAAHCINNKSLPDTSFYLPTIIYLSTVHYCPSTVKVTTIKAIITQSPRPLTIITTPSIPSLHCRPRTPSPAFPFPLFVWPSPLYISSSPNVSLAKATCVDASGISLTVALILRSLHLWIISDWMICHDTVVKPAPPQGPSTGSLGSCPLK